MAKINNEQREKLLNFMEENYTLFYGKNASMNLPIKKKKWEILSNDLNELGPPKKDVDKWEKVSLCY